MSWYSPKFTKFSQVNIKMENGSIHMFIVVQGSFIRRVCPRSHLCPNAKEINSSAHSEPIDELSFATCQKISRIKPLELIWWENVWVFVFGVCVWGTERESVPLQLRGDGAVGGSQKFIFLLWPPVTIKVWFQ